MALSKRAKANRRAFAKRYSRRTAAIVRLYALKRHLEWRSRQIDERLAVGNVMTVAATLAHLTRGTYHPYVDIDFNKDRMVGNCKY